MTYTDGLFSQLWYILTNYFPLFWEGIKITLLVALIGTIGGTLIAFVLVFMRNLQPHFKENLFIRVVKKILNFIACAYVDIVRGTPMMIQAAVFYYGLAYQLSIDVVWASLIVVSFNSAAYITEIIRSGINGIGNGQLEAAQALGLNRFQAMRKVIFPQALKNSVPALSNELIVNIKDSSVLSIIGLTDLFYSAKAASSETYLQEQSYLLVAIIYFVITFVLTRLLDLIVTKINHRHFKISSQTTPEVVS